MELYDLILSAKLTKGGGGSETQIDPLSVTENGTYTAEDGHAYSPVTVDVPNPSTGSISIIENGTYDVTDKASAIVNVPSGGRLEFESGTWSPTADTISEFIPFTNQHSAPPAVVAICADVNGIIDKQSVAGYTYVNCQRLGLTGFAESSAVFAFGYAVVVLRTSTTSATSSLQKLKYADTEPSGDTISDAGYSRYFVRENGFYARTHLDTCYFRAKYNYEWVAIWSEEIAGN